VWQFVWSAPKTKLKRPGLASCRRCKKPIAGQEARRTCPLAYRWAWILLDVTWRFPPSSFLALGLWCSFVVEILTLKIRKCSTSGPFDSELWLQFDLGNPRTYLAFCTHRVRCPRCRKLDSNSRRSYLGSYHTFHVTHSLPRCRTTIGLDDGHLMLHCFAR
jgi:hypothetical protein